MSGSMALGAAQARLICLLDDATRRICADTSVGVILTGTAQDTAVLGLVSLYKSDPVRSYAATGDKLAHAAAVRFGALHQTCHLRGTNPISELTALAVNDGLKPLGGTADGPGPFADRDVVAFFAQLPADIDRSLLLRTALRPLLGEVLARSVGEDHAAN